MCTTRQCGWCGCRRQCPQPRVGHLRQFRCNRFVLWAYWHRPVVTRLPRWWRGRQPEHGWRGGHLGGSTAVDLLRQWALLVAVAKECAHMGFVGEVVQGFWSGARGGRKVSIFFVNGVTGLTPIFQCGMFDALFLREKLCGGMTIVCY